MMGSLDDLEARIEKAFSELKNIIQLLERDINDPIKAVSLPQVKEIETSIARLRRQGLPVPTELNELKIKLFSRHELHKERISLYQRVQADIRGLTPKGTPRPPKRTIVGKSKAAGSSYRKPSNFERPLGSKGNSNLEDYLIPVIKLMWNGKGHKKAFREIAQKLDVRYNTVSSQCTRALGLTTEEFITRVNSKTIINHLEYKYPDHYQIIKSQLKQQPQLIIRPTEGKRDIT